MTNLKKVLSLALVFALALGLMVTASASNWSDVDDIENLEAAALLDSLQIMSGHADGTFAPEGFLTRAQVAKMIYVARTGGVDDKATLYVGASNTFNDISGHWAEGYINFAYVSEFVSGRGAGRFDPNASITGYELLKIALTGLGYDETLEGFVGANWKLNVAAKAQQSGIIAGYTANPNNPITRDDAAQVFANLIYANTVEYTTTNNKAALRDKTFAQDFLGLHTIQGILMANEFAALGPAETDPTDAKKSLVGDELVPATTSIDLLGYHVSALVRLKGEDIVNVYSVIKTVGMNNDLHALSTRDDAVSYVNFEEDTIDETISHVKYIDNNGDKKVDVILGTDYEYATINKVTASRTTGVVTATLVGGGSVNSTTYTGVKDLVAGDKVLYVSGGNLALGNVTVINPVAGTLTRLNSTNVYADGVKYDYSKITALTSSALTPSIGKTGVFYIFDGAVLEFAPDQAPAATSVYAYVYDLGVTTDAFGNATYFAKAVLDDGTTNVYTVASYDDGEEVTELNPASTPVDLIDGDTKLTGLYTYTIGTDGKINLTNTGSTAGVAYEDYAKGENKLVTDEDPATKYINASTIAFVQIGTKWSVYKGVGNVPALGENDNAELITGKLFADDDLVKVMALPDASAVTAPDAVTKYFVMGEPSLIGTSVAGNIYVFNAFDGTSVKEFTYVAANADAIEKGGLYTFTPVDGKLTAADAVDFEVEGVATYSANNIFAIRELTETTPAPVYSAVQALDYNKDTKFYAVDYAAGTVEIIGADEVVLHTNDEIDAPVVGDRPAADIFYTVNTTTGVVTAVYNIVG